MKSADLLSSAGTYPLPFSTVSSTSKLAVLSRLQTTKSSHAAPEMQKLPLRYYML